MRIALRPLPEWPYPPSNPRRAGQFKSGVRRDPQTGNLKSGYRIPYDRTIRELEYEVDQLDGDDILIGVGLTEWDIRLDGAPRANARPVNHPGVEISFNSRYGRLTYATDVFLDWRDNVRAITKGLEALRDLNRWGVSKRGQQYAGFAMLTAGPGLEELGGQLVQKYGSLPAALRATHPDTGGPEATLHDFRAVIAFKEALP
jgi:hypothetical protein